MKTIITAPSTAPAIAEHDDHLRGAIGVGVVARIRPLVDGNSGEQRSLQPTRPTRLPSSRRSCSSARAYDVTRTPVPHSCHKRPETHPRNHAGRRPSKGRKPAWLTGDSSRPSSCVATLGTASQAVGRGFESLRPLTFQAVSGLSGFGVPKARVVRAIGAEGPEPWRQRHGAKAPRVRIRARRRRIAHEKGERL